MQEIWQMWAGFVLTVVIGVLGAIVVTAIVHVPFRILATRLGWGEQALRRVRRRFRLLLIAITVYVAEVAFLPSAVGEPWSSLLEHGLRILLIASAGWLLAAIVAFLFARAVDRFPLDVADNRVARRVHTQVTILRRLANVVIAVVTIGAILLTFPGVSTLGASLLASAGLASVVAGLAAQSTLANLFAGLQLAFSDAIRVDDVVIADGEWGRIEEITLTYVVVHIWDDRRMVLPSTYFTNTPFQNWTRSGSELLGSVELDLDWRVSPDAMRQHLDEVLAHEPLWDGRTKVLQITDATQGWVRVRILVTAEDAGKLWDLRCNVREAMVEWIHRTDPAALPRQRVQMIEPGEKPAPKRRGPRGEHEGVFSGSAEAEARRETMTKSQPIVRPAEGDAVVLEPTGNDADAGEGASSEGDAGR